MTRAASLDPQPVMLRLLNSCFQKRQDRASKSDSVGKSDLAATETDSGDSSLQSLPPRRSFRDTVRTSRSQAALNRPPSEHNIPSTKDPATSAAEMPPRTKAGRSKSKPTKAVASKYFSVKEGQPGNGGSGASEAQEKVKTALNQLFDSLLSDEDRSDDPDGNTMSAESIQEYIGALGASCLNYEMFVVLDILEAEVFGQISRAGFVKAWSRLAADPKYRVAPDMASHRKYVRLCIDRVAKEPDYFKQLYQRAFLAGREPNQKAVRMDYAIPFWGAMFDPSVRPWKSGGIDWVEVWGRYLQEKFCVEGKDGEPKWTRTVSKDLWSQTLAFADKSVKDPTLGFWSEDQAWPGIIDDFVVWCRETGLVPAEKADGMETD